MPLPLFLLKAKTFFTSGKFISVLVLIVVSLFLATQIASFVTGYVDRQVSQQTQIVSKSLEIDQLKNQVKVMEQNQRIVDDVLGKTRIIQIQQKEKTERIEEKINEQVKEGNDNFVGPILESTIDSL